MRRLGVSIAVIALVSASTIALAQGFKKISESLTGYEETPSAVSTTGNGTFNARISNDGTRIDWELSYNDLEGAGEKPDLLKPWVAVYGAPPSELEAAWGSSIK